MVVVAVMATALVLLVVSLGRVASDTTGRVRANVERTPFDTDPRVTVVTSRRVTSDVLGRLALDNNGRVPLLRVVRLSLACVDLARRVISCVVVVASRGRVPSEPRAVVRTVVVVVVVGRASTHTLHTCFSPISALPLLSSFVLKLSLPFGVR